MDLSEAKAVLSLVSGPLPTMTPSEIDTIEKANEAYKAGTRAIDEAERRAQEYLDGVREEREFLLRAYTVVYAHLLPKPQETKDADTNQAGSPDQQ